MNECTTYVGLDVHKASISTAIISPEGDWTEFKLPHTDKGIAKLRRCLSRLGDRVEVAYEAGPTGYGLQRALNAEPNVDCVVIAPSLVPRKPGERVKTDRRDARKLAFYHAKSLLTVVRSPTPTDEALRELCRLRDSAKKAERKAKQKLSAFMLRQSRQHPFKSTWTNVHVAWLERQKFELPLLQQSFELLLRVVMQAIEMTAQVEAAIEEASKADELKDMLQVLMCLKGVRTVTAMGLISELHGFERFQTAPEFMAFLGLTPTEYSSGANTQRGGITKSGNGRIRRLLVEAAWNNVRTKQAGYRVRTRRKGAPGWAVDISRKAQDRLYKRYWLLTHRGKHKNVATTAAARELAGFVWDIMSRQTQLNNEATATIGNEANA